MIFFDQLKKNDPQLRAVAVAVALGLAVLGAGLWWIQIVSAREYQANLEMQSFRTVRIPAVRGRILDRNGEVLAENRAMYNVSLYFDDLRGAFDAAETAEVRRLRFQLKAQSEAREKSLGRKLNKDERKQFILSAKDRGLIRQRCRYAVASNIVFTISGRLGQQASLNPTNFEKHYQVTRALPFPVFTNLNSTQIALFEEQSTSPMGVDIEMQSVRFYPHDSTAAHVLGRVRSDNDSAEGEDAYFSYRLPDYKGQVGVEAGYDKELRGRAGVKSVVVNSQGYRQTENIWTPAEAGDTLVLTIDLKLQEKTERALQSLYGPGTRGAAVVMDVETGDILAMASSPTLNPNLYLPRISVADLQRITQLKAEMNRATQENYAPGSIFKTVTGLACLEAGLDPNREIEVNPARVIYVGKRPIKDTAPSGLYDFKKALIFSSNTYFISNGLAYAGIERILRLCEHLHLGERTGLQTRQETSGILPTLKKVTSASWHDGDTANICIGQGPVAVTPLQMAVMTSAIANGGRVLWPRLVDRLQPQDPASPEAPTVFAKARVRDEIGVKPSSLQIVRNAMLADVEDSGGSGVKAAVSGMRICGKTGTAQVMDERNHVVADTTWFASFAPYEKPKYAVVVMLELGVNQGSGGSTCAPIASHIYRALQELDRAGNAGALALKN
jgi:penicillin-binding protein 2